MTGTDYLSLYAMFVYISFLRPPPLFSKPSAPISFTAQITNDLRTELWEAPTDVFYYWASQNTRTKNTKLFTWKPDAAYKQLSVNAPPVTPSNRRWTLCLNCRPLETTDGTINLRVTPTEPLPVFSIPIHFEHASHKDSLINFERKAEGLGRIYTIEDTVSLLVREKTSFDLDKVIEPLSSSSNALIETRKFGTAGSASVFG